MRTLLFKVHNPSRETRVTLHRALRAYTNAAAAVLDGAAREWDRVRAEAMAIDARIVELAALRDELTHLADRAEAVEARCIEGSSICLAVESTTPTRP